MADSQQCDSLYCELQEQQPQQQQTASELEVWQIGAAAQREQQDNDADGDDDDADDEQQHDGPTSTPAATAVTMTANVIGAAVLSLSSAFLQSSLVVGILLLWGTAAITTTTLKFIYECSQSLEIYDISIVLSRAFGPRGAKVALFFLAAFPLGPLVAFARICGDSMPPVMQHLFAVENPLASSDVFWIGISSVVFFILSCRRTLSELFYVALAGLFTILFAVLCVIIRFFDGTYRRSEMPQQSSANVTGSTSLVDPSLKPFYISANVFMCLPLLISALSVHSNAGTYQRELRPRRKIMSVVWKSHAFIVAVYTVCPVFAVLTFGERIETLAQGDLLRLFRSDDTLFNVARLAIVLHVWSAYCLLLFATRRAMNLIIFGGGKWLPMHVLVLETLGIVTVCSIVAVVAPDIDVVLSINSAFSGSVIVCISPALMWLKLIGGPLPMTSPKKLAAFGITVFGFVVMILGLVIGIKNAATRTNGSSSSSSSSTNVTNTNVTN